MDWVFILQLLAIAALIVCSGFCSSAESVYFSLNPLDVRRIEKRNARRASEVRTLLSDPSRLLATILISNTIVNTFASAIGYAVAEKIFPRHGDQLAVPLMTCLLLLFGEMGPKRVGLLYAESLATVYVPVLKGLTVILTPLRIGLERLTRRLAPFFRVRGRTLTTDEFATVVDVGSEEGIINDEELGMIKAIIRLDDMTASDVMTPRVDLKAVEITAPLETVLQTATNARVNFLLVYRENLDNVEALLDVRRFLLDLDHDMQKAMLRPLFVPESAPLTRLLGLFQKEKTRIAVVVDEYGGTAGVVTRGDVLEEIAGDVFEEMGKPRPVFQEAGPHRWIVDANFALEELNRKLRLNLKAEAADRLAGWIAEKIGHLPQLNDVVETAGCRVTVLQTKRHRVTLAQIEKIEEAR